jgi:hypothetical protein
MVMLILIHHEICSNVHSTSLNLSVKEAPYLLPILEVANIKLLTKKRLWVNSMVEPHQVHNHVIS